MWESRGAYYIIGQIFGILVLRAFKPEYGLDQQSIAKLIDRSVSSISRSLSSLITTGYCRYVESINMKNRRERRYFVTLNLKEMTVDRFRETLHETLTFKDELTRIQKQMTEEDKKKFSLMALFFQGAQQNLAELAEFYKRTIELGEKSL